MDGTEDFLLSFWGQNAYFQGQTVSQGGYVSFSTLGADVWRLLGEVCGGWASFFGVQEPRVLH